MDNENKQNKAALMGAGSGMGMLASLAAMSAALHEHAVITNPYHPAGRTPRYWPRERHRDPKNTDNSPDRAKGMQPWDIDGVVIYAGTRKAAIKKARLLSKVAP
jgi:hypothetical protein